MESVLLQKMRPVGWWIDAIDTLLAPFLYLPVGMFFDLPRRSYFWNRKRLAPHEAARLSLEQMVACKGDPFAISHISIMLRESRKKYVVLEPGSSTEWYLGRVTTGSRPEVSRIPLKGRMRSTIGIRNLSFFALDSQGFQVALTNVGEGTIGDPQGDFEKIPIID